jgi:hypothetical protein
VSVRTAELWAATELAALARDTMSLREHFQRDHFPAPDLDRDSWELAVTAAVEHPSVSASRISEAPVP